jgi:hypothetical protein
MSAPQAPLHMHILSCLRLGRVCIMEIPDASLQNNKKKSDEEISEGSITRCLLPIPPSLRYLIIECNPFPQTNPLPHTIDLFLAHTHTLSIDAYKSGILLPSCTYQIYPTTLSTFSNPPNSKRTTILARQAPPFTTDSSIEKYLQTYIHHRDM